MTSKGSRSLCPENMDGRSGNDNPWDLMSMSVDGKANKASPVPDDYRTQRFFLADGKCGNQTNALPLPQWIQTPQLSHNYVEYLAESSRFLPKATTEGLLESIPSSVGGIQAVVEGVSEIQNDILYNKFGEAPASEPSGSFHDMDVSKVKLHLSTTSAYAAGSFCSGLMKIIDGERCNGPIVKKFCPFN